LIRSVETSDSAISLAAFIVETTLPGNFDKVAEAWRNLMTSLDFKDVNEFGVLDFVEEQRKVAEEKAKNPERLREIFDVGSGHGC
jgi:hypothetical protein